MIGVDQLGQLQADPENPRQMDEETYAKLQRSLEEFGDLGGIVYNRQTNTLVGGHQRQHVLPDDAKVVITLELEWPTPTGTVALGYVEVGEERFSYREVDWSSARQSAANVAANHIGGAMDYNKLRDVMRYLLDNKDGIDPTLTGYDSHDVNQLALFEEEKRVEPPKTVMSPEEAKEVYDAASIKQVVLYFAADDYKVFMERLTKVCVAEGIDTNSEAIEFLLDFWEEQQ